MGEPPLLVRSYVIVTESRVNVANNTYRGALGGVADIKEYLLILVLLR
jgi:hypothetical protein